MVLRSRGDRSCQDIIVATPSCCKEDSNGVIYLCAPGIDSNVVLMDVLGYYN